MARRYHRLYKHVTGAGRRDGWYYRLGSSSKYGWVGPFATKHVATQVRERRTGGAWGMPQASRRRFGNAMTKKHFIAVAKTLSEIKGKEERERETDRWIPMLKQQNPRFDAARFRSAVESAAAQHGNKRRRRGTCAVCGGAHSWKSCPHHHGDKRRHGKRNARTGRFTRGG